MSSCYEETKIQAMYDALDSLMEEQREQERKDKKILREVLDLVDLETFYKIMQELSDCWCYNFRYTDKPIGEKQKLRKLDIWVDQCRNGGITGDDFGGTLSILLPNKKYLTVDYEC